MIVGAEWASLSILETVDLQATSHAAVSRVCTEKREASCEQPASLVRGQRKIVRFI